MIVFTKTPDGYIGEGLSAAHVWIDGQLYPVTRGKVLCPEKPIRVAEQKWKSIGVVQKYIDANGQGDDISVEVAQKIVELGGALPEGYLPFYEQEMVLTQLAFTFQEPQPSPASRFITVGQAAAGKPFIASYDEEGHMRQLLDELWGDRVEAFYYDINGEYSIYFTGNTIPVSNGFVRRQKSASLNQVNDWYEETARLFKSHYRRWSELESRRIKNVAGLVARLEELNKIVRRLEVKAATKSQAGKEAARKLLGELIKDLEWVKSFD